MIAFTFYLNPISFSTKSVADSTKQCSESDTTQYATVTVMMSHISIQMNRNLDTKENAQVIVTTYLAASCLKKRNFKNVHT